ncbi:PREDICTED: uncharacterized protein LOC109214047 [Nicotiana attenuata]|uniref:uncharacterized protein LOC109214047 n=1 Tax=Nicotiana attenuata TaxID=49451 RepID=UPI000905080D|nr:PREDICTED: uncharacterized protein LOC109214047 [Nicotiana attenuata]
MRIMNEQQIEWEKSIQKSGNSRKLSWADEIEMQAKNQKQLPASVWDNFDIGKITNAGLILKDIESEVEYWKNVVVCYVLGAYPPFNVLNSFLQRIWGKRGIDKIAMLKNGIVMVRFDTEAGKNEVIQEGVFHFDNKPLIVEAWNVDMDFSKDELCTVPIWIRLPGLEFKYGSAKGLSKIGSLVGKPLMVDKNTEKKVGLNFARLLVEVKIGEQFPESIFFKNEKGIIIEQRITYDWKPSVCEECQKYGHTGENCRRTKEKEVKQVRGETEHLSKGEWSPSKRNPVEQKEVPKQIEGRRQNDKGR